MKIFKVSPVDNSKLNVASHIVVAKSPENAKRIIIDNLNTYQTWNLYTDDEFVVSSVEPDDCPEGTIIC